MIGSATLAASMKVSELLEVWREARDPAVAERIVAAEPRAPSVTAFEAEKKGGLGGVLARMKAFDAPADPRIGHFLIDLVERYRPWDTPKARQVLERAFALLAQHADVAIVDRLVKVAETKRANTGLVVTTRWFEDEVRKAIAALGRSVPRPIEVGLPAMKAAPPPPRDRRAALYAAVYESPDDDGPRAVLSDFLLEAGDPHGELIAAQLAGLDKRARTLLRKEPGRFADPLVWRALFARSVVFERGFVARAHVHARSAADFDRAIGAAAWATLHTLSLRSFAGWGTTAEDTSKMLAFLTHPAMRHLKRVGPIGRAELIALVAHGRPFPWLQVEVEQRAYDPSDAEYLAAKKHAKKIFPRAELE